jgi:predicted ATPase
MIGSYWYAAPRTRATLLRASALIDDSTEQPQKFAILYGIWASHYVAGEVAKQRSAAAKFLSEAKRTGDTGARCIAHRIVGTAHIVKGEFAAGLAHLKQAQELYEPEKHPVYRHQYGQDIGASVFCYLSWAFWHLGYVDQAAETAAEGIRLAEKLAHPHTLVYTICHARGFMDLFRRRGEDMQGYASAVVSVCNANGFSHWGNCGAILEGWGTVCAGQVTRGIAMLREGLLAWQQGGAGLWMPMFLMLQAEAYASAGRHETALQIIDEARGICDDSGERWAMPEVLRTKASFLLSMGGRGEIESILLESLEIARHQQARCWELRTACDLSRLWARHGRIRKAHELLQSAYSQFTEGFDTADLRDAQKLLQKLGRNIHRKRTKIATKTIGTRRRRSPLVA